jgi:prepilin-type N-terminal cleavage/methylation domain-containing protein
MKRNGFTVIELMTAIALSCIVMIPVAMLVYSGQKICKKSYDTAFNCQSQLDSVSSITSFCSFGRKSNKKDYYVYSTAGSGSSTTYTQVMPVANPEEILTGQAVEFRYWSTGLTAAMLSPTSVADSYALFYLDNSNPANVQLKVDFGTSTGGPTGGAIDAAHHRVPPGIPPVILANNVRSTVSTSPVEFSHTTKDMAGDGYGSVRMKLIINENNVAGQDKTFLAATCLRNIWPE